MSENRLDLWNGFWKSGNIKWHVKSANPILTRSYEKLNPDLDKNPKTFFLPLCGKSDDMKWLYDKGHKVIGVEAVEEAIVAFFNENQMEYSKSPIKELSNDNCFKFESIDKRIVIFVCDLFDILKVESFTSSSIDCVFDRGSLVAINASDRIAYAHIMKTLLNLNPKMRHLISTIEYDQSRFPGPPRSVPRDEVINLYGNGFEYEIIEEIDSTDEAKSKWNIDLKSLIQCTILATPKNN